LLANGADPNALTSENERPIDLVDENDLPLISMFLNNMHLNNSNSSNSDKDYDYDEEDELKNSSANDLMGSAGENGTSYYNKTFINIFKSNLDMNLAIEEIEVSMTGTEVWLGLFVFLTFLHFCKNTIDRYDKSFLKSTKFVKCLVNAICESSLIKNRSDIDRTDLKTKLSVLEKYLKDNRDIQLECIGAIYNFAECIDVSSSTG
jgi:hypothetical protein